MSTPAPPPSRRLLPLSPRLLVRLAVAFGIGLLLFLLVWLNSRRDYDFYKADGSEAAPGQTEALPAPLPPDVAGNDDGASGLRVVGKGSASDTPAPAGGSQPRILEVPTRPAAAAPPPPPAATAANDRATPEPLSSPAPRYPQEALRMGAGGTVRIRVTVAADGSVDRLEMTDGSGNRYLDRAALDAVRRWRFQPATRNGQPVVAEVTVPIVFNPDGR